MASYRRIAAALVVSLGMLATAPEARAEGDSLSRLRETLKREPKAADVVKMALDHYRVSPEAMDSIRSSAHTRAWMPVISGFIGYNAAGKTSAQAQTLTSPQNTLSNGAEAVTVFTGGVAWDLRELIFNPSELQTYAVVPMQRDIMLEIVRTYYLRRQLQLRLALKPPADPIALATMDLRLEEYSSVLNAMTGGAFGRVANASTP